MATASTRKIIKTPRKSKSTPRARPKTGLAAVPMDRGFTACKQYFHEEIDRKVVIDIIKTHIKKLFTKDQVQNILSYPEWHFGMHSAYGAAIHWMNAGLTFEEKYQRYPEAIQEYYAVLARAMRKTVPLVDDDENDEQPAVVVAKASPLELMNKKIQSTIMVDLDFLEDEWIAGRTTTIDVYQLFQRHLLKAPAVAPVRKRLEVWLLEYEDAFHKRCEQAVEGYSHIKRSELKRRIDVVNKMLEDLDRVKAASVATRAPRTPKVRTADKQVSKLKYAKNSVEYKLISINPVQIPGAIRLYTFHEKSRTLTEYVSNSTAGFEIKGTSIQRFDPETSRSVRLRKPDEFLAIILSKTSKQIDNEWQKLTTKSSVPNGRINLETILLRTLDR